MTDLSSTLADRRRVHGDFTDHARITQALKVVVHSAPRWAEMSDIQREAIEMILHKIGRVCAGDPGHPDHWHDIGGYSRLVEERITAVTALAPATGRFVGLDRQDARGAQ